MAETKMVKCKFCGKMFEEDKIVYGTTKTITICESCVELCRQIVEDKKSTDTLTLDKILKPKELKEKLDEYVINQDRAKKILSVAVYNHYKRVFQLKDGIVSKTNICLIGSSGSGKTLLANTIAKLLDVPIVIADATSFTSAGYVGKNVEECLLSLIQKADGDVKRAEKGIIFIDEIDKLATKEATGTKDIGGSGVQQALLKMIEGTIMSINKKEDSLMGGEPVSIDTSNILFIVSGSFVDIDKIINSKAEKHGIGFGAEQEKAKIDEHALDRVTQDDLIKYGMLPEFVGRIQTIAVLHKLDEEAMIRILEEPRDSLIKQYQELLKIDGVKLSFEKSAIKKIAKIAMKNKTGARCLKSILENTMLDLMYEAPTQKKKAIIIKEEDIKYDNI